VIVRDSYGSPDVLELPHQALGFRHSSLMAQQTNLPEAGLISRSITIGRTFMDCPLLSGYGHLGSIGVMMPTLSSIAAAASKHRSSR
jgi:hypothetical protein